MASSGRVPRRRERRAATFYFGRRGQNRSQERNDSMRSWTKAQKRPSRFGLKNNGSAFMRPAGRRAQSMRNRRGCNSVKNVLTE
jgi:hypothetical protein